MVQEMGKLWPDDELITVPLIQSDSSSQENVQASLPSGSHLKYFSSTYKK